MRMMDTPEQKDFPGFEHTGEYRPPDIGEWYQSKYKNTSFPHCFGRCANEVFAIESRWILRKVEEKKEIDLDYVRLRLSRLKSFIFEVQAEIGRLEEELSKA